MPTLIVKTNGALDGAARETFLREASATVAQMLSKPESYVMVLLETGQSMLFGASDAPLAYVELKSLGLDEGQTAGYSAKLSALLEQHLGVAPQRVYIEFASPARHLFGYNGATF